MPRTPSRRDPPPQRAAPAPDVSVSVAGDVEGELYVAGGDINVTQYSREDRLLLRARAALLEKVNQFWCVGVLEKSLHGAAMVDLGLRASDDPVGHPWESVIQSLDAKKSTAISPKQSMIETFNSLGRALLILGQPGSGKTITLLELTRDLVQAVRDDAEQPIPVVFNLSSWAGGTFSAWLVEELAEKYGAPRAIGARWIEGDELALMLDGLDEVRPDQRAACVEAINKFRVSHGLAPMAVTCRQAEYEAIGKQLALEGAVTLQPLTEGQIDAYLKKTGDEYTSLRKAVKDDPALRELAQTPLMLTVMMLAYKGVQIKDIPGGGSVAARRKHLFDQYIQRMMKRRPANAPFSEADILKRLRWIALRMAENNQSIFMLENIQPSWLPSRLWRWAYDTVQRVVGVPLLALMALTITMILIMLAQGIALGYSPEVALYTFGGPLLGSGVFFGLVAGAAAGRSSRYDIHAVEALRWSWGWSWRQARLGAILGLAVSLTVALITFFFTGWFGDAVSRGGAVTLYALGRHLTFWWLFGLGNALCWGLLYGLLFGGLRPAEIETTRPNQGMRQSFRNGQTVGLGTLIGLGALLLPMVVSLQYFGYNESFEVAFSGGTVTSLSVSALASFVMSLRYGALAVIQHITVRVLLAFTGAIPLRLATLLDLTSDLILTRKVGGGYIFAHRLLMEHMAGVESDTPEAVAARKATAHGTAYWFVPEKARRQIDFRRVERVAKRAGLIVGGALALALLVDMLAANFLPNLYSIGGGAALGGVAATGRVAYALGWSADGSQVATLAWPAPGKLEIDLWNAKTGAPIRQPYGGGFAFESDYISPNGRYLATFNSEKGEHYRGYEADVWVWDMTTGQLIQTLPVIVFDPDAPVAWSPDGRRLAVGSAGQVSVWDALKGDPAITIPLDELFPYDVAWSADGSTITARSAEGLVASYRASDGSILAEFRGGGAGVGAFSPDGTKVALDDQESDIGYFIYDVATGEKVGSFESDVVVGGFMVELLWSPDGSRIAAIQSTLSGGYLLTLRDAATGAEIRSLPLAAFTSGAFSWSPDGQRFTLALPDGALAILDADSGQTLQAGTWAPTNFIINSPRWSPDGSQVALLGWGDRSVVIQQAAP